MLKKKLISGDEKIEKKIISLVNQICKQIQECNTLQIGLNPTSFRYFSAFNNPIMAGKIGREMDTLQKIQCDLETNLATLGKIICPTNLIHQGYLKQIQDHIQKCHKNTIRNFKKAESGYLKKLLEYSKSEEKKLR